MVISALLITLLIEQLLFTKILWQMRVVIIIILAFAVPSTSVMLLQEHPNLIAIGLAVLSLGRLLNLFRVAQARMHEEYLRNTAARTSKFLGLSQVVLVIFLIVSVPKIFEFSDLPLILAIMQLAFAVSVLAVTTYNLHKTRYIQGNAFYADRELPTVSLLIPARNETIQLEECLRSALASDYSKLEIIVLDDCSQMKTSDIIKSFAHQGVRFIRGDEPNERWLAKNQAYDKLQNVASGNLLLFCGVDVRFGPHAIKALVTELLNRDKQMISILPHRLSGSIAGAFIQPMRYWWELALPRKLVNRPPVLSTAWLIRAKTLEKLGGFPAVSHSIIPEGFFARELVKSNNYSFIRANDTLDIQTRKSFEDQRATALRTRYPQLRRRPENVILMVVAELTLLLGPFIGVLYSLLIKNEAVLVISLASTICLVATHVLIVQLTSPANTAVAIFNLPVEVLTEVIVALMSMVKYEFGKVDWKDRNVCIPVMHVIPRLPEV